MPALPALVPVASYDFFRHFSPFCTMHQHGSTKLIVLFRCPRALLEMVRDLVMPAFSTVLVASPRNMTGNFVPADILSWP